MPVGDAVEGTFGSRAAAPASGGLAAGIAALGGERRGEHGPVVRPACSGNGSRVRGGRGGEPWADAGPRALHRSDGEIGLGPGQGRPHPRTDAAPDRLRPEEARHRGQAPVSYTHLTLPTIYSV